MPTAAIVSAKILTAPAYFKVEDAGFKTLAEGEAVEFDLVQGQKGPAAENVSKAASA